MQQLRHALRGLARRPGLTLTAVVILALGIGANTALFTFVDAVLLRPLPVRDPDGLVVLRPSDPRRPGVSFSFSYPGYLDFRDATRAIADVLAESGAQFSVVAAGEAERVDGGIVSGNYFSALGVDAALGRVLTPEDDRPGAGRPVAVLDYGYWVRRFGGDPAAVGKEILVNGQALTIVGVTPASFYGTDLGRRPAIRVPLASLRLLQPDRADRLESPQWRWLKLMARLERGVTVDQARARLAAQYQQVLAAEVAEAPGATPTLRDPALSERLDLRSGRQGFARLRETAGRPLLLLTMVTLAVWVIACVNLAHLLLVHGLARQRELAIRLAIGGSRGRLVRQLMVENCALAVAGGVAGLFVAAWLSSLILGLLPPDNRLGDSVGLDPRVLVVTFLLSLFTALLFGLAPALRATRGELLTHLKADGGQRSTAAGWAGPRGLLIVVQVALSVVLLTVAALFVRSLANIYRIDLGLTRDQVLVSDIRPSLNGYGPDRSRQLFDELLSTLDRSPDIAVSALGSMSPMSGGWDERRITVDGYHAHEDEDMSPRVAMVSPGYFSALGIRLLRGRLPDARDTDTARFVAVVNETMARHFFGDGDAIGRVIRMEPDRPIEVVGVVSDSKYVDPREERTRFIYVPLAQHWSDDLTVVVRARNAAGPAARVLRQTLKSIDPQLPLGLVTTLESQVDSVLALERVLALFTSAFGTVAVLLAAVGLYGVLAFTVARRSREFGVRLALGARPVDVAWLVARQTVLLVGAGVVIGVGGATVMSRFIGTLLYEVHPMDAQTIVVAALLVASVSAIATALPARRATLIEPAVAIRNE